MKFKSLFILFNIVLLLFLVILVFMPYFLFGSVSGNFLRSSWVFLLVWVVLFSVMNVFYFTNHALFILLEKEDWPALARYLEERVIQKGRYSARLVRLLANTYLVLADSASVTSLENKAALVKPVLVDANALVFGTARILSGDIAGAARFFDSRRETAKPSAREWVRWYYGFALLLDSRFEKAGNEFCLLARVSKDAVITALSSYFLSKTLAHLVSDKYGEYREVSALGKGRVLETLPLRKNWSREVSCLSTEIHAAALSKYTAETESWLYGDKTESVEEM